MPKRSKSRDTAKAAYIARKAAGEEVSLRELAQEQGVPLQDIYLAAQLAQKNIN